MDKETLGLRLARAREAAGMTQESLGQAVGLDRTAITRLERGERQLNVPELVSIASVLNTPLARFVSEDVPSAISRRAQLAATESSTAALDAAIEEWAADVRSMLDMGILQRSRRVAGHRVPIDHPAAEAMAAAVRRVLIVGNEPIDDLGAASEKLGLIAFSMSLGQDGPDGGCVEIDEEQSSLGAAVINGDRPSGRRRMTLAHELGHWLTGDAYDSEADTTAESMINSFAIHFLAPRAGVSALWSRRADLGTRDRAMAVAAEFRLSWSAAVSQLRNLDLISWDQNDQLRRSDPTRGDYARLQLQWIDELGSPYLPPAFTAACVNAYADGRLTSARVLELLRGTLSAPDLPSRGHAEDDILRRAFADHDA